MDITNSSGNNFKIKSKLASITTSPFSVGEKVIYGPGEYEIGGVSVMGFKTREGKCNIFLIEADKLSILFLNDLIGKLDSDLIDSLGDIDIVLATTKDGVNEALKLEPYYVISTDMVFIKDTGLSLEETPKFSVKKEDIMEDQSTKAIFLTRK